MKEERLYIDCAFNIKNVGSYLVDEFYNYQYTGEIDKESIMGYINYVNDCINGIKKAVGITETQLKKVESKSTKPVSKQG